MVRFHCPTTILMLIPIPDFYEINKGSIGTESNDDSYAELLLKLLEFHFIDTNISVKWVHQPLESE